MSGAAAATLYLLSVFKIPPKNADSDMSKMYGNITLPKLTERSNLASEVNPLAVLKTSTGIIISATAVKVNNITINSDNASEAKASGAFFSVTFFERSGIKAVLKAPSAKSRRNMFGNVKATKKASATGPAPRKIAISISRMKPSIRLHKVQRPTTEKFCINRLGKKRSSFFIPSLSRHLPQLNCEG